MDERRASGSKVALGGDRLFLANFAACDIASHQRPDDTQPYGWPVIPILSESKERFILGSSNAIEGWL
jgi:hypothetical protein